jgi:hypothetical protein
MGLLYPVLLMEVTRNQDEVGRLVRELGYRMLAPATGKELERPEFATACVHADDRDALAGAA